VPKTPFSDHVFINCPFDDGYRPIFQAFVFAIHSLGFKARCAAEADDSGEVRILKIERIIGECAFGLHDISAVKLDEVNHLPRFNMPLELGMFLGCKRFGGRNQKMKSCLVLDVDQYRYQKFISDIAGQDIRAHGGEPELAIVSVRNWLATASGRKRMPGGAAVTERYRRFTSHLPAFCGAASLKPGELTFIDLVDLITRWLKANR
jgi:hypothetical protein